MHRSDSDAPSIFSTTRTRISVVAVIGVLACAHVAFAQTPDDKPKTATAQAHLDAGTQAFKKADFATASTEFAAGYAAEPWSGFLFAWAQSERRRGDCPSAVKLYRRFVATSPPAEVRQLAEDGIAACGGPKPQVTVTPDPPVEDKRVIVVPPDETAREIEERKQQEQERSPPPFQHKLAVSFVVGGVAFGGVATAFYFLSRGPERDAMRATSHPEAMALYDTAKRRRLGAQITGGVGIAFGAVAIIRFALHRPDDDRGPTVSISPAGDITFATRW